MPSHDRWMFRRVRSKVMSQSELIAGIQRHLHLAPAMQSANLRPESLQTIPTISWLSGWGLVREVTSGSCCSSPAVLWRAMGVTSCPLYTVGTTISKAVSVPPEYSLRRILDTAYLEILPAARQSPSFETRGSGECSLQMLCFVTRHWQCRWWHTRP